MTNAYSFARNMRNDLVAETRIPLPTLGPDKELRIETQKTSSGLACRASVVTVTKYGYQYVFGIGGDFSRLLERDPKGRATEKNVRAMHERHATDTAALAADACKHYANVGA